MPCVTKEVSGPPAGEEPSDGNGEGSEDGLLSPQAMIGLGIVGAAALIVVSNKRN